MQSNSELKEVIKRLDSELRREKSNCNLYKEQGRAGHASEEEAKLVIEDFNDRLDESLDGQSFPRKNRVYSNNFQIAGISMVDSQAKEIEKLKSIIREKEEDVKAMLEI
jgi:hypothetical protein